MVIVSLFLRVSAVAAKFGLAAIVSAWFGLAAFGDLSLLISLAVIYSKLAGLGFYFYANREQVNRVEKKGELLVSQYSLYVLVNVVLLSFLLPALTYLGALKFSTLVVAAVLFSEHLAHELHQTLLASGRPSLANGLFCFRALGWFVCVVLEGMLNPGGRSIDFVVSSWAVINCLSIFAGAIISLRHASFFRFLLNIQPRFWKEGVSVAARYYSIAVMNAVSLHGDRFLIAYFSDSKLVGIYSLLWSFANALQTVVANSVHLGELKEFLEDGREARFAQLRARVVNAVRKSVFFVLVFSIAVYFFALLGARFDSKFDVVIKWMPLFTILSLASAVKLSGDVVQQALYALSRDGQVVRVGSASFVMSLALGVPAVALFSILGAGTSYFVSAAASAMLYWRCLQVGR